jgi:hypothetical protein
MINTATSLLDEGKKSLDALLRENDHHPATKPRTCSRDIRKQCQYNWHDQYPPKFYLTVYMT